MSQRDLAPAQRGTAPTAATPRLMAQPSVALLGEYRLPGLPIAPPTAAEQTVMHALAAGG
jgi:hypothetical protein